MFFSFGKKKTRKSPKRSRKPPAALLRKCRKHRVKTTMRKGSKRVYRKVSVLKKLLKKAMAKKHKSRSRARNSTRRRTYRRSGFGSSNPIGYSFETPDNYGYNQKVKQTPQALSQSSSVVNEKSNFSRPDDKKVPSGEVPTHGVYRDFFGQQVPTQLPAHWNYMGQPDGSLYAVGSPFQRYTTPIASFGKKRKIYRKSSRSACSALKKKDCNNSPMCKYTRGRGCRRKSSKNAPSAVISGDEPLGEYAEAAGISFFGKKRRYRKLERMSRFY